MARIRCNKTLARTAKPDRDQAFDRLTPPGSPEGDAGEFKQVAPAGQLWRLGARARNEGIEEGVHG
jgi:hypothetical protein